MCVKPKSYSHTKNSAELKVKIAVKWAEMQHFLTRTNFLCSN